MKNPNIEVEYYSKNENIRKKTLFTLSELDKLKDKDKVDGLLIENLSCVELDIDLTKFINLDVLVINNNVNIKKIPSIKSLTRLNNLYIYDNNSLVELPCLDGLKNLSELCIYNNISLIHLPSLNEFKYLRSLKIFGNKKITSIPSLDNLINLQKLNISYNNITELPKLDKLIYLTKIYVNGIKTLPRSIIHCNSLYKYRRFKDYKKVYNNNFPDLVNYIISKNYYYLPIMEYYNETYLG